jgi:hypothetical protein
MILSGVGNFGLVVLDHDDRPALRDTSLPELTTNSKGRGGNERAT